MSGRVGRKERREGGGETDLLLGEHVAHAVRRSWRSSGGRSGGQVGRCGAGSACCSGGGTVGRASGAATATAARERDELGKGPSVEVESDVCRSLKSLCRGREKEEGREGKKKLLALGPHANDVLALEVVGGEARLGVLERVVPHEGVVGRRRRARDDALLGLGLGELDREPVPLTRLLDAVLALVEVERRRAVVPGDVGRHDRPVVLAGERDEVLALPGAVASLNARRSKLELARHAGGASRSSYIERVRCRRLPAPAVVGRERRVVGEEGWVEEGEEVTDVSSGAGVLMGDAGLCGTVRRGSSAAAACSCCFCAARPKLRKPGVFCAAGTPRCHTGSSSVTPAVPSGSPSSSIMRGLASATTLWLRKRYRPARAAPSVVGDAGAVPVRSAAAAAAAAAGSTVTMRAGLAAALAAASTSSCSAGRLPRATSDMLMKASGVLGGAPLALAPPAADDDDEVGRGRSKYEMPFCGRAVRIAGVGVCANETQFEGPPLAMTPVAVEVETADRLGMRAVGGRAPPGVCPRGVPYALAAGVCAAGVPTGLRVVTGPSSPVARDGVGREEAGQGAEAQAVGRVAKGGRDRGGALWRRRRRDGERWRSREEEEDAPSTSSSRPSRLNCSARASEPLRRRSAAVPLSSSSHAGASGEVGAVETADPDAVRAEPSLLSLSRNGLAEVGVSDDEVEVELARSEPWLPELRRRKTFARLTGGLDEVGVDEGWSDEEESE
ncbi:uncharacterized protein RHOBADRAFT_21272 [Rhodotorula graminis WP1]|uniref:Uncharacterized protein n=1 Tax=Rhodotorula graminis (strain WP1) TaxID=578459 RepID=A0A194SD66_RHOGW|nr:uncharacterized protein RHOBADRAFT_21272 [Rhodotorula graminis WP1]KPV78385.1 hypothetical protein RHOBADRAFT_21272 [Rhodotorula graminis WP1]